MLLMAAESWKEVGQGWPRERREDGEEGRAPAAQPEVGDAGEQQHGEEHGFPVVPGGTR